MSDRPERPAFDAFKRRVLANPDARRAYVAARMQTLREDRQDEADDE